MKIIPNGNSAETTEKAPNPNALPEGQDQVVLVLDLRRENPDNPDGSPEPDLAMLVAGRELEQAQALSFLVDSIAEVLGFDPALSLIGVMRVVDYEPGSGLTTLDTFRNIIGSLSSASEPKEVQTEQEIEVDTGATIAVDSDDVATVLESDSESTPEVIEDVPHDLPSEDQDIVNADDVEDPENGVSFDPETVDED